MPGGKSRFVQSEQFSGLLVPFLHGKINRETKRGFVEMNAALLVMEFGDSPEWDRVIVTNVLLEEESHEVGFMFWTWKENGSGGWGVFAPPAAPADASGCLRADREALLARVYPRTSADRTLTYHYDASDGSFTLKAGGHSGDPSTVVYVPLEVTGQITSAGAVRVVVSRETDGGRVILAAPTGGEFVIAVSPAPLELTGCV